MRLLVLSATLIIFQLYRDNQLSLEKKNPEYMDKIYLLIDWLLYAISVIIILLLKAKKYIYFSLGNQQIVYLFVHIYMKHKIFLRYSQWMNNTSEISDKTMAYVILCIFSDTLWDGWVNLRLNEAENTRKKTQHHYLLQFLT